MHILIGNWVYSSKMHILVVIRFREKKADSKKVPLEKWGRGWSQLNSICVIQQSLHLAGKFEIRSCPVGDARPI